MKSHESDLLELLHNVYRDACSKCTANSSDVRDLRTIGSRVENEGISFLTITLPSLGSDFERCLSLGELEPGTFRSFKKYLKAPAFLRGFFAQVFDVRTGRILNEPSVAAVEGIRQIAYTFKKIRLDCTIKRFNSAFDKFKQEEAALSCHLDPRHVASFVKVSNSLWSVVFENGGFNSFTTLPKHGPGSTAESVNGNEKYRFRSWYDRLEPYFPLYHYAFSSESAYGSEAAQDVSIISPEDELPVRVIGVPKTLKSPRIIAIEPVCMQYTQQAVSRFITNKLESTLPTRGHINFTDQSVNREIALKSSLTQQYATVDLSAASDRVPLSLAMRMFDSDPVLQGAIFACRSRRAKLPSGEILHLNKFASMGSALCFPIEAMYFYTLCVMSRLEQHSLPTTFANICKMAKDVYVYGDDILVPTDEAVTIVEHLEKYYCKVNSSKSFWSGNFRESCGMDAFMGEEVTPTYVREMRPNNRQSSSALVSWVETSNLFYSKGYWKTSRYMLDMCQTILGELPVVGPDSAALGPVSFQPYVSAERYNRKYHVHEVKAWVASPVYRTDKLDGYGALLKFLSRQPGPPDPSCDVKHLERTARHGAVTLKRRWTRPY